MPPPPKGQLKFVLRFVSFNIDDWRRDTNEFPHLVRSAYLSAIIEYMKFDCIGILNDEIVMQRACECYTKAEWDYVKDIVFGHFFKLDEATGRFHQKRALKEYRVAYNLWLKAIRAGQSRSNTAKRGSDGTFA